MTDDSGAFRRTEDRDRLIQLGEAVNHMNQSMGEVKETLLAIRESLNGVQVMKNEVSELKAQNVEYRNKLQDHEVRFGQIKVFGWIFGFVVTGVTSLAGWSWSQLDSLKNTDSSLSAKVLTLELKQDNMNTLLNITNSNNSSSSVTSQKK